MKILKNIVKLLHSISPSRKRRQTDDGVLVRMTEPSMLIQFEIDDLPGGTGESKDIGYSNDAKNIRRDFPI